MQYTITAFFVCILCNAQAQPSKGDIQIVLKEINLLRSQGYQCGSKWMPPAQSVTWDHNLYKVSNTYAKYMAKNNHFDHVSKQGEDLGDRLDHINYKWKKIGENLAYGYRDFYSVIEAWKKSPSHCEMLLDPDMNEMGLSKHDIYWVQSFSGTPRYGNSISAY